MEEPSAADIAADAKLAIMLAGFESDTRDQLNQMQELMKQDDKSGSGKLSMFLIRKSVDSFKITGMTPNMIKTALEKGDTDGTGDNISYKIAFAKLVEALWDSYNTKNIATAKEVMKKNRGTLTGILKQRSPDGNVSSSLLQEVLRVPLNLSSSVINSVCYQLGLKEGVDVTTVSKVFDKFCAGVDEEIIAIMRQKLLDKYHQSLNHAFQAMSTSGAITKDQLISLLQGLGLGDIAEDEVNLVVSLADVDGSGAIELDEFNVVFGAGEKNAKKREDNFRELQLNNERNKDPEVATHRMMEKVARAIKTSYSDVMASFRSVDQDGSGRLETRELQAALEQAAAVKLSSDDAAVMLTRLGMDSTAKVDFTSFVARFHEHISRAETVEDAQQEIAKALQSKHATLVKAFEDLDKRANMGTPKQKISRGQMARGLQMMKFCLPAKLVKEMVRLAAEDGNDIPFQGFVRMLGKAGADMRSMGDAAVNAPNSETFVRAPSFMRQGSIKTMEWTAQLEEEIRHVLKGKFGVLNVAFRSFDKDGDGKVSREELKQGLEKLQLDLTPAQIQAIIKRADEDGNGNIDYNEFRLLFETGAKADALREKAAKDLENQERKQQQKEEEKAGRASSEPTVELLPKTEDHFWTSLHKHHASMAEAFAFIKGRDSGKHADVITEKEFVVGVSRLELTLSLQSARKEEEKLERLQRFPNLTEMQKKDILVQSGSCTEEVARRLVGKLSVERKAEKEVEKKGGGHGQDRFGNGQAQALFRALNVGESGLLRQSEFVSGLSRWQERNKQAAEALTQAAEARRLAATRSDDDVGVKQHRFQSLQAARPAPLSASNFAKRLPAHSSARPASAQPSATRRVQSRDAHHQIEDMIEQARQQELNIMKQRLAAIRTTEERLQSRGRDITQREAQVRHQEAVLAEREALLEQREQAVQASLQEVEAKRKEVQAMSEDMMAKVREVELKGQHLQQQKELLEQRAKAVSEEGVHVANLQQQAQNAPPPDPSSPQKGVQVEKLAGVYRDSLEMQRNSSESRFGKDSLKTRRSRGLGNAANKAGEELKRVATALERDRLEFGGQFGRIEELLKGLGAPMGTGEKHL